MPVLTNTGVLILNHFVFFDSLTPYPGISIKLVFDFFQVIMYWNVDSKDKKKKKA